MDAVNQTQVLSLRSTAPNSVFLGEILYFRYDIHICFLWDLSSLFRFVTIFFFWGCFTMLHWLTWNSM